MKNLNAIALFVAVGDTRSFTLAGLRLGLSPSAVSKAVSRLEKELGTSLVNRTTRRVALSTHGELLYERFRNILSEVRKAEADITWMAASPRGLLRVQMPVVLGRRIICPVLPIFAQQFPDLVLNIELSDRSIDLVKEKIDVAIKIGRVADSRLIAKKLCNITYVTCASPEYIRAFGEPRTPAELAKHRCLAFFDPKTMKYREWNFRDRGRSFSQTISGRLNYNNTESLIDAAISGAGIISVSTFAVANAVSEGKLKLILEDFVCPGPPVYAVYLPQNARLPRVRAFVDHITKEIRRHGLRSVPVEDVLNSQVCPETA